MRERTLAAEKQKEIEGTADGREEERGRAAKEDACGSDR